MEGTEMLGYMDKKAAAKKGMTHHGRYYGIPVWLARDGNHGAEILPKWKPMEPLLYVAFIIETVMWSIFKPSEDPVATIYIGPPIEHGEVQE